VTEYNAPKPKPKAKAPKQKAVGERATYVGPLPEVSLVMPSGRPLKFKRGECLTVLAGEALALAHHPEFRIEADVAPTTGDNAEETTS
jgi:hypothetical protein